MAAGAFYRLLPCARKSQLACGNAGTEFRRRQHRQILPSCPPSAQYSDLSSFLLSSSGVPCFGPNTPDPHGKAVPRGQRGPVYSLRLCAALLEQDQPVPGFFRHATPSKQFRLHQRAEYACAYPNKGEYPLFVDGLDVGRPEGHIIGRRDVRAHQPTNGYPARQSDELCRATIFCRTSHKSLQAKSY